LFALPAQAGISEEAALVFCQEQLVANLGRQRRIAGAERLRWLIEWCPGPRATPANPGSPGSSQPLVGLG
jgi:hypothetical protein